MQGKQVIGKALANGWNDLALTNYQAYNRQVQQAEQDAQAQKALWKKELNSMGQALLPALIPLISQSAPDSVSQMNYVNNAEHDITGTFIFDQRAEEIQAFRYGNQSAQVDGCGPIAVYNALQLFGKEPSFAMVIKQLEQEKSLVFSGAFGTDPNSLPSVLSQYGIDSQKYSNIDKLAGAMQTGDVAVMMIWNKEGDLQQGAHYFTVQKAVDGYEAYGRNTGTNESLQKADLLEVLANGQYISGYILQQNLS